MSPAARNAAAYDKAKRAMRKHEVELYGIKGVTGLSVGQRIVKGKRKPEMAIRLHVKNDKTKERIKKSPDKHGLKEYYGGVRSDIVVSNFGLANGNELPDGTCIRGGGGQGTLGTTVYITMNGKTTGVWLTAAHVASANVPQGTVDIQLDGGGKIGTVSPDNYFRSEHVDAALIVPDQPVGAIPSGRPIYRLKSTDQGKTVTIKGCVNSQGKGTIDSLHYDGDVLGSADTEFVQDHFLVVPKGGNFAQQGDSGAIVFMGNKLAGQLRAVDKKTGIAVVTRLSIARGQAKGFRL